MFFRTSLFCTILALLSISALAQDGRMARGGMMSQDVARGSVSGSVRTADDRPAKDARVELWSISTGQVVAAGYTSQSGTFDFSNIENGGYELTVTAGLDEVRQRIEVHGADASVNLRMSRPASAEAGTKTFVSVAQLKVPGKARNAFKKAQQAMTRQELEAASRHVEEALSVHPEYSEALTLRGILRLDAGKVEEAIQDFDHAIRADNSYSFAYFALGAAYNMSSRFDDALRTIDRGLALSPTSWQAYFEMGKAFLGKGSYDAAVRQLNKAQDLGPKEYPLIHLVKAHALLGQKNYPEAMAELQWYIDKAPTGDRNSVEARQTLEKVRAFAATTPVGK
jgi:Flp pilus assembly protein TadD